MFHRYGLRTTDLAAARAFYAEAIGLALPDGIAEGSALEPGRFTSKRLREVRGRTGSGSSPWTTWKQ